MFNELMLIDLIDMEMYSYLFSAPLSIIAHFTYLISIVIRYYFGIYEVDALTRCVMSMIVEKILAVSEFEP